MGSRPIAAFILARYELRIDDAVFVPFGQQLESFFHFWLNRIHRHFAILYGIPEVGVRRRAFNNIRWDRSEGAKHRLHRRTGEAVRVFFTIFIRIIVRKLVDRILELS
ncbi:hypothetical protein D3C84_1054180 [compost metagenome]